MGWRWDIKIKKWENTCKKRSLQQCSWCWICNQIFLASGFVWLSSKHSVRLSTWRMLRDAFQSKAITITTFNYFHVVQAFSVVFPGTCNSFSHIQLIFNSFFYFFFFSKFASKLNKRFWLRPTMRNRKQSGYKLDNVRVRWIKLPFRETFSNIFSWKKEEQIINASFSGADYQTMMFFSNSFRPFDETHVEHWKNSFWASSAFFKGSLMTNYLIPHIFCISIRFLCKWKKKSLST